MRVLVASALLVAGCAAVEPRQDDSADLARVLEGRVPAETQTCVPVAEDAALRAINSSTLIYHRGATIWVSRLPGECPGLGTTGTLIVETSAGQYCTGDRFRELEWGATIPAAPCLLGDFTAYRRPR